MCVRGWKGIFPGGLDDAPWKGKLRFLITLGREMIIARIQKFDSHPRRARFASERKRNLLWRAHDPTKGSSKSHRTNEKCPESVPNSSTIPFFSLTPTSSCNNAIYIFYRWWRRVELKWVEWETRTCIHAYAYGFRSCQSSNRRLSL